MLYVHKIEPHMAMIHVQSCILIGTCHSIRHGSVMLFWKLNAEKKLPTRTTSKRRFVVLNHRNLFYQCLGMCGSRIIALILCGSRIIDP